jgi:hypothetical protein
MKYLNDDKEYGMHIASHQQQIQKFRLPKLA